MTSFNKNLILLTGIFLLAWPSMARRKGTPVSPPISLRAQSLQKAQEVNALGRGQKGSRVVEGVKVEAPIRPTTITGNNILANPQAAQALQALKPFEATVPIVGKVARVIKSNTLKAGEMSGLFAAVRSYRDVKHKCTSTAESCVNRHRAQMRRFLIENGIVKIADFLNCGTAGGRPI